jgi:hypothetical protein
MPFATVGRKRDMDTNPFDTVLSPELDNLLLDVRGLVLVRELLAERGATSAELDAHTDELERRRRRLAELVGGRTPSGTDDDLGQAA